MIACISLFTCFGFWNALGAIVAAGQIFIIDHYVILKSLYTFWWRGFDGSLRMCALHIKLKCKLLKQMDREMERQTDKHCYFHKNSTKIIECAGLIHTELLPHCCWCER